jgi:hypothetical protein
VHRHGSPCPGDFPVQAVLGCLDRIRRRAQQPGLLHRCRFPRHAAGDQRKCVEQAVRTGLGLKAQINLRSLFDRKNYFYPDLPQGYQISQYKDPIVGEGEIIIDLKPMAKASRSASTRLHLEQDAGKSLHDQHPDKTFVDLNRSGIALMEIVSKPHMRSSRGGRGLPEEAAGHRALSGHLRRQHGRRLDALPTSMSRSARSAAMTSSARPAASRRWAPAARSRTSIPCASSPRRWNMKPAARSR